MKKWLMFLLWLPVSMWANQQFKCVPDFTSGEWKSNTWSITPSYAVIEHLEEGATAKLKIHLDLNEPKILVWNWLLDMSPNDRLALVMGHDRVLGLLPGNNTITTSTARLPAGKTTLTWIVFKNDSAVVGLDSGYLNWVQLLPVPPTLQIDGSHVFWTADPRYVLQSSTDLKTWVPESDTAVRCGGSKFFRLFRANPCD